MVLIGATRLGKTEWARSLGPHCYFGGLFNLDEFRDDVLYAVFDDVDIDFFPHYKQWFGCQQEFTATDKYRAKRSVKWGKPIIWCSNDDPREGKGIDRAWMNANCVFVQVHAPLFSARASTE